MKLVVSILAIVVFALGDAYTQPQWQWATTIRGRNSDVANCISLNKDGTVFTSGSFSDSALVGTEMIHAIGNYDFYWAQFDSKNGKLKRADVGGGLYDDDSYSVVGDKDGNYYVAGETDGEFIIGATNNPGLSEGNHDMFVAKINKSGLIEWVSLFGSADEDEGGVRLALDDLGNVYFTGYFGDGCRFTNDISVRSAGISDAFVAKLNSKGEFQWVYQCGGLQSDYTTSIAVTPSGDRVYVTGIFSGNVVFGSGFGIRSFVDKDDYFIASINGADGKLVWAKRVGGNDIDKNISCTLDKDLKLVVVGSFSNEATFDDTKMTANGQSSTDAFVYRITRAGLKDLLLKYGSTTGEAPTSVATDNQGNILVAGFFNGTSVWDKEVLESAGSTDGFVAKLLQKDGQVEWVRSCGGAGADAISAIAVDKLNIPYVAGYYEQTAKFGPISVPGDRLQDGFVAALECGPNTALKPQPDSVVLCAGTDSTITARLGYPYYTWFVDGVETSNKTYKLNIGDLPVGSHKVWVNIRDLSDCTKNSDTIDFLIYDPIPKPVIVRNNMLLSAQYDAVEWVWYREGKVLAGNTSSITAPGDGTYRVRVRDSSGCTALSDPIVIGSTDVQELDASTGIKVFPNPTSSNVHVTGLPEGSVVTIFNALGEKLETSFASGAEVEALSERTAGLYTILIDTGKAQYIRLVVKR